MLMDDATWMNQLMLQYLSNSPTRVAIDDEVGEMETDFLGGAPMLTYLRYNVRLEPAALTEIGLGALSERATDLRDMSAAANRNDLASIGSAAALKAVQEEHFLGAFDVR